MVEAAEQSRQRRAVPVALFNVARLPWEQEKEGLSARPRRLCISVVRMSERWDAAQDPGGQRLQRGQTGSRRRGSLSQTYPCRSPEHDPPGPGLRVPAAEDERWTHRPEKGPLTLFLPFAGP